MAEVLNLKMDNIGTPGTFLDSSPSGHTITTEGNATQIETALTNRRTGFFFDGDSDYISIPDSADWDIAGSATQDYTIDFWSKQKAVNTYQVYVSQDSAAGSVNGWRFSMTNGGALLLTVYNNDSTIITLTGGAVTAKTWHHIALVKKYDNPDTKWGLYMDGIQVAYVSDSSTKTITQELTIGATRTDTGDNPRQFLNGHMKNIRISTSNVFGASPNDTPDDTITVPTANPVSDANTKLLLLADAPAQLNSPLGSTSYYDGTSDCYFTVPDSADWDPSTDYCIEFWLKWDGATGTDDFIEHWQEAGESWRVGWDGTNLEWVTETGGTPTELINKAWTPVANQWYHIAFQKDGTVYEVFVDGTSLGTNTEATAIVAATGTLNIGVGLDTSRYLKGYLKEIRISSNDRYTADFTPSTVPFVSDANTLLLLHFNGVPDDTDNTNGWMTDSGNTGHTLTRNADVICKYIEDYRRRTVVDSGNTGHHGLFKGTAKLDWITVQGNGAGKFDGTGDYLSVAQSENFDFSTDESFSVRGWFKFDSSLSAVGLVGTDNASDGWAIFLASSTAWHCYQRTGAVARTLTAPALLLNQWYYCEVNRLTNAAPKLFINGSLIGSFSGTLSMADGNNALLIGTEALDADYWFNGKMDELLINKSEEINSAAYIPPTYLVGDGKAFQSIVF